MIVTLIHASVSLAQTTTSTTTTTTTTKTTGTTPAPVADPDGGWPRSLTTASGATLIMYQPQILSWDGQSQLEAMAALSYSPKGASQPTLGTIRLSSPTSVSMEDRLVNLSNVQIAEIKFSTLSKDQSQEVAKEIQSTLPNAPLVMSLDRVLAAMDRSQIQAKGVQVRIDPPQIFSSSRPAILVQFDGDPILSPIDGTSLKYVINTNWDVFLDTSSNLYYLRNETNWLSTTDPKGTWEPAQKLPDGFYKLRADDNWKDVKANIPGKKISKDKMPTVFFSTAPAEMILMDGAPKYAPVKGTNLLWVSNTESDIFRMKDAKFYFLVSGRWFSAAKLEDPWTFATPDLPADFLKIPGDHERARVLASVPGSSQAAEAVLLAQVPQTARVNAKEIKAPEVKYAGDPQFQAIEGSSVTYASNASHDVVLVGNTYYLCSMGVWFSSGSPNGPWLVTTSVPSAVYGIPPSAPVYSVTYVTVVNPDPYYPVYAYTPGYMGVTISYGCVMYGTGYYYPPYYHYPPYGAPIYYPRPVSYGCGAMYNPHTGAYGYYQHAYGPYGGVACGASYNPYTGTYKRGAVAYGPYGASGYAQAYNPRTGAYGETRQGSNAYGSWGSSSVQRGDDWARTQRVTDSNGNTRWAAQGSGGGSATGWNNKNSSGFVGEKNGNVYAGKDGNVYRKTDDGWQSYSGGQGGGWSDVNGPQGKPAQTSPGGAKAGQGQAASGATPSTGTIPSSGAKPATGVSPSTGAAPSANTRPSSPPSGAQSSAAERPAPSSDTMGQLNHDAQSRSQGDQRAEASSSSASGAKSSGGSRGGGGGRRR